MLDFLTEPATYLSLLSLTLLEIVLGIDNVIFISILAGKLPATQRNMARRLGLLFAVGGRLLLLLGISWLVKLTEPLLSVAQWTLSGKDLVLLLGGAFLIYKSTHEIYDKVERGAEGGQHHASTSQATLASVLVQIMLIDVVFSLDSIITAVGLVNHIGIMVMAILISLGLMIAVANHIGDFIDRHPSIKILALSFLLMIGTMLVAEAFHVHIPKGYIYASLVFALIVEFINIRANTRKPHTV